MTRARTFQHTLGLLAVVVVGCSGADVYEYRRPPGQVIVVPDFLTRSCPEVRYFTVAPIQTSVGGHITLTASIPDVDGGKLHVEWSGPGAIDDPAALVTTYTCTEAGAQTIELALTTDDGCRRVQRVQIVCF